MRIKPPYRKELSEKLRSLVFTGLKSLKDTGRSRRWINYEDLCLKSAGDSDLKQLYEWHHYWNYWYERFRVELSHTKRKIIFRELIVDLHRKGFLPSETSGLTGNVTISIEQILKKEGNIKLLT